MHDARADRELLEACAAGDRKSWEVLIGRLQRRVLLVLSRTLGAAGEGDLPDLAQEVWERLLLRDAAALRTLRLEHEGALAAYVGRVALRVAIDHARRRKVRPQAGEGLEALAEVTDGAVPVEDELSLRRERRALALALPEVVEGAQLQRDLLILRAHFEDGLTPAEIAGLGCGLSAKGVESLLRRARARLIERLAPGRPT